MGRDGPKHERRRLPFFEIGGYRIETRGVVFVVGDERAVGLHGESAIAIETFFCALLDCRMMC